MGREAFSRSCVFVVVGVLSLCVPAQNSLVDAVEHHGSIHSKSSNLDAVKAESHTLFRRADADSFNSNNNASKQTLAKTIEDLSRCVGRYCGREDVDSPCGRCPRAHRSDGKLCAECTDSIPAYEIFFLGFNVLIIFITSWGNINEANEYHGRGESGSKMSLICIAEILVASLTTTLLFKPVGSLELHACRMKALSDWYAVFHDPSQPCLPESTSCSNEVPYPLITWVLSFDAIMVGLITFVRLPICLSQPSFGWGIHALPSLYYALPAQALLHVVFGGFTFYAFPYFLTFTMLVMLTIVMAQGGPRMWSNFRNNSKYRYTMLTMCFGLILGVSAASTSFHSDKPILIIAYILSPLVPVGLFQIFRPLTETDQIRSYFTYYR